MPLPQIINVDKVFSKDSIPYLHKFIQQHVDHIYDQNKGIREELLPRWIRTYRGTPAEPVRQFPWPGASNLIIQVAATHADELLARVMGRYQQETLFSVQALGMDKEGVFEDERQILEKFLTDTALEPEELDLYRVEECWSASAIRYGTGIIHFPWETITEKGAPSIAGVTNGKETYKFETITKRDGPHPEVIPLNLFGIDLKASTLGNSKAFYRVRQMNAIEVKELLLHPEIYDVDAVRKILSQPTRTMPDETTQVIQEESKPQASQNECADQWDIYELWFKYRSEADAEVYSLIAYYFKETETHLGCIFNPYPKNIFPFEDAKLAYDDDTYHGTGFMQMLEHYQREVSATHNWRTDNRQFATTGIGRVNKNSKLSSILQIYPGILIPADKDEVEWFQQNANSLAMGVEDEQQTLALAKERSGVDPAMGGSGGGIVNAKRGIYSSQGTSIVMQAQNNRNNLRTSDLNSGHTRFGRKVLTLYSELGLGTRIQRYGDRAELLKKALADYKNGRLGLLIRPINSSMNRELEKQNDILMSQTIEKSQAAVANALQAYNLNAKANPELATYYLKCIKSIIIFSKHMLRNFNYPDVDRLVPEPDGLEGANGNGQSNGRSQVGGGQFQAALQQPGSIAGNVPVGSGTNLADIPAA